MHKLFAVLIAILMGLAPLAPACAAGTKETASLEFKSDFEPIVVDYEYADPDTGVTVILQGVLLSETSYRELIYTQKALRLELDLANTKAESWKLRWTADMQAKDSHIGVLEVELSRSNTWFARNKGGVGFGLGVFVTVLSSIGMAYAFAGAGNIAGGN